MERLGFSSQSLLVVRFIVDAPMLALSSIMVLAPTV